MINTLALGCKARQVAYLQWMKSPKTIVTFPPGDCPSILAKTTYCVVATAIRFSKDFRNVGQQAGQGAWTALCPRSANDAQRSEERRVGKECRYSWSWVYSRELEEWVGR